MSNNTTHLLVSKRLELKRQEDYVRSCVKEYYEALSIVERVRKWGTVVEYKKNFSSFEKIRDKWWKAIDSKNEIEQDIHKLEKRLLKEI